MAEVPTIKVEITKQKLLEDLGVLEGVVAEYCAFLRDATQDETPETWEADALLLLRSQQSLLANARVSLKTFDLVSSVMRKLLGRIKFHRLRLRVPESNGSGVASRSGDPPLSPEMFEQFEELIAQINSVAGGAPLAYQEKIRFLLLSGLNLFRAVVNDSKKEADDALTQINLLTSSRESQNLVREIALIARDIYETLNALSEGIPIVDTLTESSDGISEAADKLKAVVKKLEEAAFGNLDFLEQLSAETRGDERLCARVAGGLKKSGEVFSQLKAAFPEVTDSLTSVEDKLNEGMGVGVSLMQAKIQENADTYMSLTANQSFQDLTGQTLKKTIDFIENLEVQLLGVLQKYKPVFDAATSGQPKPAEETPKQEPSPRRQSQEDVDQLLSVLGF